MRLIVRITRLTIGVWLLLTLHTHTSGRSGINDGMIGVSAVSSACPGVDAICQGHGRCNHDTGRCHCDDGWGHPDCRLYWTDSDYRTYYSITVILWGTTLVLVIWRFIVVARYKRAQLPSNGIVLFSSTLSTPSLLSWRIWRMIFDTQLTCIFMNLTSTILFFIASCMGHKSNAADSFLVWQVAISIMDGAGAFFTRFFLIVVAKFSPASGRLIRALDVITIIYIVLVVICVIILSTTVIWSGALWSIITSVLHICFLFINAAGATLYTATILRQLLQSARVRGNDAQVASIRRMLLAIGTLVVAAFAGMSFFLYMDIRPDSAQAALVAQYYLPWIANAVFLFILGRLPRERSTATVAPAVSPSLPSPVAPIAGGAATIPLSAPPGSPNPMNNNGHHNKLFNNQQQEYSPLPLSIPQQQPQQQPQPQPQPHQWSPFQSHPLVSTITVNAAHSSVVHP